MRETLSIWSSVVVRNYRRERFSECSVLSAVTSRQRRRVAADSAEQPHAADAIWIKCYFRHVDSARLMRGVMRHRRSLTQPEMKPLFRPTCPICGCDAESFFRQEHGFHLVEFYECAERANDCRPFAIVFAPTSLSVAYPYTAKKPEAFDVARGAADVRCPGCHAVLNLNGPLEGEHFPEQWEAWCSTENCQTNEYRIELTQRSIQTINFSSKDAEAFAGEFEEFEAWLNGD